MVPFWTFRRITVTIAAHEFGIHAMIVVIQPASGTIAVAFQLIGRHQSRVHEDRHQSDLLKQFHYAAKHQRQFIPHRCH